MNEEQAEFAQRVLGARFTTDFTVVAVGPGPTASLLMYGDRYEIGLDELQAVVDRGLVVEMPAPGGGPGRERLDTH